MKAKEACDRSKQEIEEMKKKGKTVDQFTELRMRIACMGGMGGIFPGSFVRPGGFGGGFPF